MPSSASSTLPFSARPAQIARSGARSSRKSVVYQGGGDAINTYGIRKSSRRIAAIRRRALPITS